MEAELVELKAQLEEKRGELKQVGYRYLHTPHYSGPSEPEDILAAALKNLEHTRMFVCNDGWGWRGRQRKRMAAAREKVTEAEHLVAEDTPERRAERERGRETAAAANDKTWDNFILTTRLEKGIKAIEAQIRKIEEKSDDEPPEPPAGNTDRNYFDLAQQAAPGL